MNMWIAKLEVRGRKAQGRYLVKENIAEIDEKLT